MTHTGTLLLERLHEGELDAAGLLADWLEDHGDPRGARLRREWRLVLAGVRRSWLLSWLCPESRVQLMVTPEMLRRAEARQLADYAERLLSVWGGPVPRPWSRVGPPVWGCSR